MSLPQLIESMDFMTSVKDDIQLNCGKNFQNFLNIFLLQP